MAITYSMSLYPVICPTCFEEFMVTIPPPSEAPAEVDYDCEICCRPMIVVYEIDDDEVYAYARGIHD
ncbi:MAG: CPXCG motif-containing cysteine-rich protein [Verrucomicrobiales bacterium]|nr:CPXCG motif-containing cysteine-rich protein [Verrucomicrobiales bacterium]